ncbi:MAG: recombinase family protein [Blautia sp.]|nr:recombinase family protein [Blautia sp.]
MKKTYHAAVYLRLSKEDGDIEIGDKRESNSISNQKDLIMEYLQEKPEIEIVSVRTDDGYSGVDFNRPEVQEMFRDIEKGIIDCVVVKDLSRFGRNYIEVGKYLERIFPAKGIRFIAINDNYDSANRDYSQDIVMAFRNLINDSYLRDLSIKIRSHLEIKRKNGEFIGAFVCYGYLKSEENKNRLVIDPFAAEVVRDIFRMKMDGMSSYAIAEKLNELKILSPMEYKKSIGLNYETSFKAHPQAAWSANAVLRILTNEIYTGTLVQGRKTTPNHKLKVRKAKDEKEWARVENSHEPVIDRFYFEAVQRILERDTRTSPGEKYVYPLCGLVYCGDCGSPMIRNIKRSGDRKYFYYICKNHRETKKCSSHRISEEELLAVVFAEIQIHIKSVLHMKDALERIREAPARQMEIKRIQEHILKKEEELQRAERLKCGVYEDLKDELIDVDEYRILKAEFEKRIASAREAIEKYQEKQKEIQNNCSSRYDWMEYFTEYKNIPELTRRIAVIFIDRILIYEENRMKIVYTFQDEFMEILSRLTETGEVAAGSSPEREDR